MEYKYVFLQLCAVTFYSFMPVMMKHFKYDGLTLTLLEGFIGLIMVTLVIFSYDHFDHISIKLNQLYSYNITHVLLCLPPIYFLTYNIALQNLPASIGMPITNIQPIIIILMNKLFYNIDINNYQYMAFVILLLGTYIVSRSKSKEKFSFIYILILLCGVFTSSLFISLMKLLPESKSIEKYTFLDANVDYSIIVAPVFIVMTILSVFTLSTKNKILPKELHINKIPDFTTTLQIMLGFLIVGYVANILGWSAYQHQPINTFATIDLLNVPISLIVGYYILNEKISLQKIMGCVLIIFGCFINIMNTNNNNKYVLTKSFKPLLS